VYLVCGGTALASPNPATNPAANIPFTPPAVCGTAPTGAACEDAVVAALDSAGATLGLGPYDVPKDFDTLPPVEQMFILSDLDRVAYGLLPATGLSPTLNTVAGVGVTNDTDPDPTSVLPTDWDGYTANWAGAFPNAPDAYYEWMYDDGPGGPNADCVNPGDPGCWGHRQGVVGLTSSLAVAMGAASGPDSGGTQGYAMTLVGTFDANTTWTTYNYTWAQALADINGTPPTITSISPSSGPQAGGTTVTITGSGFTGATRVGFGGLAATSFTVVSDTQITAVSPAQSGAHYVTVTTPGGTNTLGAADIYTYTAPTPAITGISPTSGPPAGGTTVTITGSGFTGATRVAFGALAATSYTVVSDSQITAVSPAQTGAHYITVTAPGGTSATVAAAIYTYKPPAPAITTISPTSGPTAGGTTVTITGSGFTGATRVGFGALTATSYTVNSDTQITAVSPAQSGAHYITVTAPGGTSATGPAAIYSYTG
jgi:hypothetical protein